MELLHAGPRGFESPWTRRTSRAIGIDRERTFARLVFAALDGLVLQQLFFGRLEETQQAIEELGAVLRLVAECGD